VIDYSTMWTPSTPLFEAPPETARANELFIMDVDVFNAVLGSDEEDLVGVMTDLVDADLFHLPYPRVDLRVVAPGGGGWEVRGLELGRPGPGEVRGMFGNRDFVARGTLNTPHGLEKFRGQLDVSAAVLILSLATRNTVKTTVSNKRAKFGIGKRRDGGYTRITRLSLPRSGTASDRGTGKKRMHLRRGHGRTQHYGPGNQQTKRIFVAPTWVNPDGDYVPRKGYRL
jgi:hypothetical protein